MMVIMYASVMSILLFSKRLHNTHFSLTVIFLTKENIEWCGSIIDNRYYEPVFVLKGKDRKRNVALNNMLKKFLDGNSIVEFAFKVTANVSL